MATEELQTFAENYSGKDFDKIKFSWNGKHGDQFDDPNYSFRMELCEFVKSDFSVCPDQLLIDLYIELSKCAKETFAVYNSYHLFANELLERGGAKYIDIYIEGASKSMDTYLASGRLSLTEGKIDDIVRFIYKQLEKANGNAPNTYVAFKERFEWLKKHKSTS